MTGDLTFIFNDRPGSVPHIRPNNQVDAKSQNNQFRRLSIARVPLLRAAAMSTCRWWKRKIINTTKKNNKSTTLLTFITNVEHSTQERSGGRIAKHFLFISHQSSFAFKKKKKHLSYPKCHSSSSSCCCCCCFCLDMFDIRYQLFEHSLCVCVSVDNSMQPPPPPSLIKEFRIAIVLFLSLKLNPRDSLRVNEKNNTVAINRTKNWVFLKMKGIRSVEWYRINS